MAKGTKAGGSGSKKSGHSEKIETLAGKTLASKTAGQTAKKLAGAVLAHSDGKPNKKP